MSPCAAHSCRHLTKLKPSQHPTKRGLIYAAAPASDFVCGTQQALPALPYRSLPLVAARRTG
ncbi:galactarate dehydrogenase [Salmonella enterica subsp. houtenae serovar 50:g,z51:- str. 01-0133]|nr:galactarate dehydrogenase [Salmonella enterica subsp. houtenae serovar 50:g,z51:- str. 01-0133]